MKAFSYLAILGGLLIIMNSCTYTDDTEHFVSPVPGEPPVFSVQCNLDTLPLIRTDDEILVSYSAEIDNGVLYYVSAEVNELLTYDTLANLKADSTTGALVLSDSFYVKKVVDLLPGENILDLYFFVSTNSNTIADLVGAEADIIQLIHFIYLEEESP